MDKQPWATRSPYLMHLMKLVPPDPRIDDFLVIERFIYKRPTGPIAGGGIHFDYLRARHPRASEILKLEVERPTAAARRTWRRREKSRRRRAAKAVVTLARVKRIKAAGRWWRESTGLPYLPG